MSKTKCYEVKELIRIALNTLAKRKYSLAIMYVNESMDSKKTESILKKYVKCNMRHQDDIITLIDTDDRTVFKALVKDLKENGFSDNVEILKGGREQLGEKFKKADKANRKFCEFLSDCKGVKNKKQR